LTGVNQEGCPATTRVRVGGGSPSLGHFEGNGPAGWPSSAHRWPDRISEVIGQRIHGRRRSGRNQHRQACWRIDLPDHPARLDHQRVLPTVNTPRSPAAEPVHSCLRID